MKDLLAININQINQSEFNIVETNTAQFIHIFDNPLYDNGYKHSNYWKNTQSEYLLILKALINFD